MQTFKVKRWEDGEFRLPLADTSRFHGLRAPGRIIMVVQEGSGWVLRQDGTHADVAAKSVVTWDTGDWVEYGCDGSSEFKFESYWEAYLSEEEWAARMAEVFGPEALG